MPRHKLAIFVHGCFFRMHKCRYGCVVPATNVELWHTKTSGNTARDKHNAGRTLEARLGACSQSGNAKQRKEKLGHVLSRVA